MCEACRFNRSLHPFENSADLNLCERRADSIDPWILSDKVGVCVSDLIRSVSADDSIDACILSEKIGDCVADLNLRNRTGDCASDRRIILLAVLSLSN